MKIKILFCFLAFASLGLVSCGGDDCADDFNYYTELSNELNVATTAAIAFGLNPTSENCEAYKAALQDYIDAAQSLRDCANDVGQGAEFEQDLQDAQDEVDAIQC